MTKAERAEMAALRAERDLYKSFRISPAVGPDVAVPDGGSVTRGWLPVGSAQYGRVEPAASRYTSHATGEKASREYSMSWTQGGRPLYSTRALALRQLRHEVCKEAAKRLVEIDRQIAEAEAEGKGE